MGESHSTRKPEVLAFEKAFPGVIALDVRIADDGYAFNCEAPPETMIAWGLVTQAMFDALPSSGIATFSPRRKHFFCPFYAMVKRRRDGRLYLKRCWSPPEERRRSEMLAFCRKIGIDPPPLGGGFFAELRKAGGAP